MAVVELSRNQMRARALWYVAPGRAELREEILQQPGSGEAVVRTLWTGISRGTERLVAEGLHHPQHQEHMRAPLQAGSFPYPVKYGYCAVGHVEHGPAGLVGRSVFALYPHQDVIVVPVALLMALPAQVPPRRATLAANMETALNGLWDAGAGPGDRIVVVGGGIVGLLLTFLAAAIPGTEVTLVDSNPARRDLAAAFGAAFATSESGVGDADMVFHCSASEAGLATALAVAGTEAAIVELSWYGDRQVGAPLGLAFHHRRLRLVASQVGQVSASRRVRWSHARRLQKALAMLGEDRLDRLITEEVAFAELPHALPRLLARNAAGLGAVVRYAPHDADP
jgi:threonine dehydrogenase-like Zn-dependent dehydrogenase